MSDHPRNSGGFRTDFSAGFQLGSPKPASSENKMVPAQREKDPRMLSIDVTTGRVPGQNSLQTYQKPISNRLQQYTGRHEKLLSKEKAVQNSSLYSTLALTQPKEEDLEPYNLLKEKSPLFIQSVSVADLFVNRNYLDGLASSPLVVLDDKQRMRNGIQIREIIKFVYDDPESINDRMRNVYSALHNYNSTIILILKGSRQGVTMYFGVAKVSDKVGTVGQANNLLADSLQGNFPGSTLSERLGDADVAHLMREFTNSDNERSALSVACVTAIPSARQEGTENKYQDISQFIDSMRGQEYTCMLVATPVTPLALTKRIQGYEELHTSLSPYANISIAHSVNSSDSTQIGSSKSFSKSISHGISSSNSTSDGQSGSSTRGSSSGTSGDGYTSSTSSSYTDGWSHSTSSSMGQTDSEAFSSGHSTSSGRTYTNGTGRSITVNFSNKHISNLLEQTEQHIKRLKESQNFGLWECAAYFLAPDSITARQAASAYKSLLVGDEGCMEKAYINVWDDTEAELQALGVLDYLEHGIHPLVQLNLLSGKYREIVSPATFISGRDLPLFMGMPNKSVCGLPVVQMASFGRNVVSLTQDSAKARSKAIGDSPAKEKSIQLGDIFHRGMVEKGSTVRLNIKDLAKHCFVTGSTGSGKSNTMYCLLERLHKQGIAFMVVEPAKGEYKTQFGHLPGINIFTAQPNINRLLKINPFRFPARIHILEHLDRLLEIFKACWEMTAAMPALLKKAVERAYLDKGWDMTTSRNVYTDNPLQMFPTFEDLLVTLRTVVEESDYSNESKGNYKGALVSRVESLTNGVVGQMLCSPYDVDDSVLFDETCVVDLSRIGSSETKSLLMGLLVMKLNEHRVATAQGTNQDLRHVTVLEEAHNLLPNCSNGGGEGDALKAKSVEMLSNSIAEMRTYGEAFIIVDQSPSAVSGAAIKNTNTKILLRLPDAQDAETVGLSVGLDENQIHEIAKLPVGVAVTMQSNWQEAVLVKIDYAKEHKNPDAIHDKDAVRQMNSLILHWVNLCWNYTQADAIAALPALISRIQTLGLPPDFIKDMSARLSCLMDAWKSYQKRLLLLINALGFEGMLNVMSNSLLQTPEVRALHTPAAPSQNPDAHKKQTQEKLQAFVISWLDKNVQIVRDNYLPQNTGILHIRWLLNQVLTYHKLQLNSWGQKKQASQIQEVERIINNQISLRHKMCARMLDWATQNWNHVTPTAEADLAKIHRIIAPDMWKKWRDKSSGEKRSDVFIQSTGIHGMADIFVELLLRGSAVDDAAATISREKALNYLKEFLVPRIKKICLPDMSSDASAYHLIKMLLLQHMAYSPETDLPNQTTAVKRITHIINEILH